MMTLASAGFILDHRKKGISKKTRRGIKLRKKNEARKFTKIQRKYRRTWAINGSKKD